eukprot:8998755-Pyramimonas_sp.AAC.1
MTSQSERLWPSSWRWSRRGQWSNPDNTRRRRTWPPGSARAPLRRPAVRPETRSGGWRPAGGRWWRRWPSSASKRRRGCPSPSG